MNLPLKLGIILDKKTNLENLELLIEEILYSILNRLEFKEPNGLSEIEINNDRKPYLLNLLRRYVRKYKNKIPKSTDLRSFQIDANMYEHIYKEDGLYINIMRTKSRVVFDYSYNS